MFLLHQHGTVHHNGDMGLDFFSGVGVFGAVGQDHIGALQLNHRIFAVLAALDGKVTVLAVAVAAAAMLFVQTVGDGSIAGGVFGAGMTAQGIALSVKAGGCMGVGAPDGDAAGVGGTFMSAFTGGGVAAVGGVAGMMLTKAVFFGGKSCQPEGCRQGKGQNETDTPSEKGFAHGFGFLLNCVDLRTWPCHPLGQKCSINRTFRQWKVL